MRLLTDAGIQLNVLVSDLHGQAGRAMVKAINADRPLAELHKPTGRLKASWEELFGTISSRPHIRMM